MSGIRAFLDLLVHVAPTSGGHNANMCVDLDRIQVNKGLPYYMKATTWPPSIQSWSFQCVFTYSARVTNESKSIIVPAHAWARSPYYTYQQFHQVHGGHGNPYSASAMRVFCMVPRSIQVSDGFGQHTHARVSLQFAEQPRGIKSRLDLEVELYPRGSSLSNLNSGASNNLNSNANASMFNKSFDAESVLDQELLSNNFTVHDVNGTHDRRGLVTACTQTIFDIGDMEKMYPGITLLWVLHYLDVLKVDRFVFHDLGTSGWKYLSALPERYVTEGRFIYEHSIGERFGHGELGRSTKCKSYVSHLATQKCLHDS